MAWYRTLEYHNTLLRLISKEFVIPVFYFNYGSKSIVPVFLIDT